MAEYQMVVGGFLNEPLTGRRPIETPETEINRANVLKVVMGKAESIYLLNKNELSDSELAAAIELVRFAEDQFVHWELAADENGFGRELTPCVHEQYFYETPVDASCAETAGSFMGIYRRTGDRLALEKAKALLNAVTRAQNITNGQIPTTWEFNSGQWDYNRTFWPNCTYACVVRLLAMDELLGE